MSRGGRGYSLIRPKWLCAAEQDMVLRVLSTKQDIQFRYLLYLEQGMFLHWKTLNHSPLGILQKNAF